MPGPCQSFGLVLHGTDELWLNPFHFADLTVSVSTFQVIYGTDRTCEACVLPIYVGVNNVAVLTTEIGYTQLLHVLDVYAFYAFMKFFLFHLMLCVKLY